MLDKSVTEFTELLASKAPVPGGGGASALVGAIGIALGDMVGELTVGKKKYAAVEEDVKALMAKAQDLRVRLLECVAYYALGFPTLVLTAGAVYLGAWLLLQGVMAHPGGIVQARLTLLGKSADLHLLRDTGNTLRDPFTGRHVPVVEARVLAKLLPELPGQDAVQTVQALHARFPALTVRLLPYRAVGTEGAMLPAIRCDSLRVGNREKRNILVAISPTKVSENGEYEGLIGEGD